VAIAVLTSQFRIKRQSPAPFVRWDGDKEFCLDELDHASRIRSTTKSGRCCPFGQTRRRAESMEDSMTGEQLEEMASTKQKDKPQHKHA
jgi:hypothetical protein